MSESTTPGDSAEPKPLTTEEENAFLKKEIERMQALLDGNFEKATKLLIENISYSTGQPLEIALKCEVLEMWAHMLTMLFEVTGAGNYFEVTVNAPRIGPVIMTLQKEFGKTPHQLRQAAEAERDALQKRVDELEAFACDMRDNYDHRESAHQHNNLAACPVCVAEKLVGKKEVQP